MSHTPGRSQSPPEVDMPGMFAGVGSASQVTTAPFLTNLESNMGRITLTAPDNMRRRRQERRAARAARHTVLPAPQGAGTAARPSRPRQTHSPDSDAFTRHVRAARARARPAHSESTASTPEPRRTAMHSGPRIVNVWDEVEAIHNLDDMEPPPPSFSSVVASAAPPVPSSPPPAFVSDPESSSDSEQESVAVIDPARLREQDAWERDRLFGYSLEERVERMQRRQAQISQEVRPSIVSLPRAKGPTGPLQLTPAPPILVDPGPQAEDIQAALLAPLPVEDTAPVMTSAQDTTPPPSQAEEVDRPISHPPASEQVSSTSADREDALPKTTPSRSTSLQPQWGRTDWSPRSPSVILHEVKAPAPLSGTSPIPTHPSHNESSSSGEEEVYEDEEDSEEEWRTEHDAIQALYRYEAEMRRMLPTTTTTTTSATTAPPLPAPHLPRRVPPLPPSTTTTESSATDSSSCSSLASSPEPDEPPHENNRTTSRPLPPPPPSRVSLIRTAYDQLHAWQAHNEETPAQVEDIASLVEYVARYEPPTDGSNQMTSSMSHFGGAFTNPRSSVAPWPSQTRLPPITAETRHFPRTPVRGSTEDAAPEPASQRRRPPPPPPPSRNPRRPLPPPPPREGGARVPHTDQPPPPPQPPARTSQTMPSAMPLPEVPSDGTPTEETPSEQEVVPTTTVDEAAATEMPMVPTVNGTFTDLDFAIAHLDHPTMQYEWASLISEFLGPARAHAHLSSEELQNISLGRVELDRRRVTSAGQVRIRMSVAGLRVDRCGICLHQFRPGQRACIFPCLHMYV